MAALRTLLFIIVFYGLTIPWVMAALIGAALGDVPGQVGALWNADNLLELVVNGGSFASRLLLMPGGRVRVPSAPARR